MKTLDDFNIIDIVVKMSMTFRFNRPNHNCSKSLTVVITNRKTVIMSKFFSKICLFKDNDVLKSNTFLYIIYTVYILCTNVRYIFLIYKLSHGCYSIHNQQFDNAIIVTII